MQRCLQYFKLGNTILLRASQIAYYSLFPVTRMQVAALTLEERGNSKQITNNK